MDSDELRKSKPDLVGLLKAEKKQLKEAIITLAQDKSVYQLLKFAENKQEPYLFVTTKGEILGYNDSFKKGFKGETENLIGENYFNLYGTYSRDKLKWIRKFFLSGEKREFDIKNEKEIPILHIIAKPAIPGFDVSSYLKLGSLKKEVENVDTTIVPLIVYHIGWLGRWGRIVHHEDTLDDVIEKCEEEKEILEERGEEIENVRGRLVGYDWEIKKILRIEEKMGGVKSYLYFKDKLAKLDKEAAKKRKNEKRKGEKDGLKKMKANNSD